MKLTIIPVDGSVGEDEKFYSDLDLSSCSIPANVHALQWDGAAGWIEFNEPIPNEEITSLPSWANCCMTKWDQANNPPIPDPVPPTAEQNKATAITKLQETDWATIPDVADPAKSNPYLSNSQDFITYRNAVRQYAVYPVAGDINWPEIPQEVWMNV
jgi:hypothetical protein